MAFCGAGFTGCLDSLRLETEQPEHKVVEYFVYEYYVYGARFGRSSRGILPTELAGFEHHLKVAVGAVCRKALKARTHI